jgi:hypothetical protein
MKKVFDWFEDQYKNYHYSVGLYVREKRKPKSTRDEDKIVRWGRAIFSAYKMIIITRGRGKHKTSNCPGPNRDGKHVLPVRHAE